MFFMVNGALDFDGWGGVMARRRDEQTKNESQSMSLRWTQQEDQDLSNLQDQAKWPQPVLT